MGKGRALETRLMLNSTPRIVFSICRTLGMLNKNRRLVSGLEDQEAYICLNAYTTDLPLSKDSVYVVESRASLGFAAYH